MSSFKNTKRILDAKLKETEISAGNVYFNIDNKVLYKDLEGYRTALGGVKSFDTEEIPEESIELRNNLVISKKSGSNAVLYFIDPSGDRFPLASTEQMVYVPTWGEIRNRPEEFDPTPHEHSFTEITGVAKVNQIPELPFSKLNITQENLTGTINLGETQVIQGINSSLGELEEDLDSKVDKVSGKGLSTNDYTNTDKQRVGKIPTIEQDILDLESNKVDKVSGKGLSTNDFTTILKNKLDGIEPNAQVNVQSDWAETDNTADSYIKNKPEEINISQIDISQEQVTGLQDELDSKVDKVSGKGLSTNDYTNTDKQRVGKIPTIEQDILDLESNKVDKVSGKGLSTNDFTTTEKNKLSGIQTGAQVNKIESISLDSEVLPISSNKRVSIPTTSIYAWALKQELDPEDVPNLLINQITGLQDELDSLQTDISKAVLTTTDQDVAGEKTFKNITTFEKGVIIPGQNSYIDIGKKDNWFWTRFSGENWTFNNTYTGGGWARNLMEMKDDAKPTANTYFRIGAQGSGQNFTQMYIGPAYNNYWLSLNDDRALFRAKPQYASNPTTNNDLTRKYYVDTQLSAKQDKLVSGNNIKSFNGKTLLGSGAFEIATNKVLGRTTTSPSQGPVEQIDLININSLGFAKTTDIPTIPDIELSTTGNAGVITSIAVDGTNKHKLNITRLSRSGIDTRTIFPTNWASVGSKPTNLTDYGITLTGDVSNIDNEITISDNAITNAKIQNSTIELDKLVNIGSQTVLGNTTSSTGGVTTIPLINIDELDLVKTSGVDVNPTNSTIVKRGTDGSALATSFKTGSAEIKYNNTTKSIDFIFS